MADGLHQPYPHYTRASYNALDHVNPVPKVRLSGKSPQVRPHASFRRSRAAVVVRGTPSMPCRMRLRAFWFRHVCSDRINVSVKAPPRKLPLPGRHAVGHWWVELPKQTPPLDSQGDSLTIQSNSNQFFSFGDLLVVPIPTNPPVCVRGHYYF